MAQDFARKLYLSKEWRELRRNLIIERGPVCVQCNTIFGDTSKLIGHHKTKLTPQNINDVNVTLNPVNIDIICKDCHDREDGHFIGSKQRSVYIVYGSPLSGKTTMVNQLMERGDMVLDVDSIFASISGMPLYDKPDNLRFNVFAIRDKIIDMIKTRYGKWHDAYIIGGYPRKTERERLAMELGAELIYCESTKEECLANASLRNEDWWKWVEKWWSEYEPDTPHLAAAGR